MYWWMWVLVWLGASVAAAIVLGCLVVALVRKLIRLADSVGDLTLVMYDISSQTATNGENDPGSIQRVYVPTLFQDREALRRELDQSRAASSRQFVTR